MRIEGYAVVSEDGMIADASGLLPPALIADADQRFFERGLDGVDAVVHGRHSGELSSKLVQTASHHRHAQCCRRHTRSCKPKSDLVESHAAPFEDALAALKIPVRSVAILGGTEVFGLFLDRYTVFFLSRVAGVRLPGGRPVFPQVPVQTPESVLAVHGMHDKGSELSDLAARLKISRWERPA